MKITGTWNLSMKTPRGTQKPQLTLTEANKQITGTLKMPGNPPCSLTDCKLVGTTATMKAKINNPVILTMAFAVEFDGDAVVGTCTTGSFTPFPVTGSRFVPPVDHRGRLERWRDFLFG